MHPCLTFLFVCISLAAESANALPIPALMRSHGPSWFGAFRASHVTLQEWAVVCVFVSGILFSVIWAFVLTTFARAGASSFTGIFSLGATSSCPFRRLYALPSPFAAVTGGGRGASRRTRVAMRRGGVAYPMAAGRRWYQAQRQGQRVSAV